MTAIEHARAAAIALRALDLVQQADAVDPLIAEYERLSTPPTDDERECRDCGRTDGGCDRVVQGDAKLPGNSDHGPTVNISGLEVQNDAPTEIAPLTDDEREALVDAALLALMQSPDVPTGVRPHLLGGEVLVIRERCDAEPIARAVLDAAGLRRQGPITVTTVPEMDALPARTVVMDGGGEVYRKCANGEWDCLDSNGDAPTEEASTVLWQSMNGPRATVLWEPVEAAERAR